MCACLIYMYLTCGRLKDSSCDSHIQSPSPHASSACHARQCSGCPSRILDRSHLSPARGRGWCGVAPDNHSSQARPHQTNHFLQPSIRAAVTRMPTVLLLQRQERHSYTRACVRAVKCLDLTWSGGSSLIQCHSVPRNFEDLCCSLILVEDSLVVCWSFSALLESAVRV